ncbi:MAG: M24 family metallopeptidase [Actinomycetota bacterium]
MRARLADEDAGAFFVTNLTNIRYLTGFTGSNGFLVVDDSEAFFFSDGRYKTQAAQQVQSAGVQICLSHKEVTEALRGLAARRGYRKVCFEGASVTAGSAGPGWSLPPGLDQVSAYFEGAELMPTAGWVEELRKVKEPAEIELIAEAARLADEGIGYIIETVRPGRTERDIALDLEFFMRRSGADDVSFDVIVAAGERSALPHATPTSREVEAGGYLLLDLGCVYRGYCSDITRTFVVRKCDGRHREVYEAVLAAQLAGLGALRAGAAGDEVDRAARDVLDGAGLGDKFIHGLGHGVGLEIHEGPTLRKDAGEPLPEGAVVTVEPGAYIEGWGGVRIEDLVVLAGDGAVPLSKFPKELTVL